MTSTTLLRYAAFTDTPHGGNPAGIVLGAEGLTDERMQDIAAEVGYSETAFLVGAGGGRYRARYFSALAEVPFCGHATIASAVAVSARTGESRLLFQTLTGDVPITLRTGPSGIVATLTSVTPWVDDAPPVLVSGVLSCLRWQPDELDAQLPPRIAFAGARHLLLAAGSRQRLRDLDYDFDALKQWMLAYDLTTVDLVWRETATVFHARNPFPVGGAVEDPATGAAAAAFGAYLRALSLVALPAAVTVLQGEDMGRPSRLLVEIDADPTTGIRVSGQAVEIEASNDE